MSRWAPILLLFLGCRSTSAPDTPANEKVLRLNARVSMKLVWIAPGTFVMGEPNDGDPFYDRDEHTVKITRGFWMQTTEVTQAQWTALMGDNPSKFPGDDRPVERVSWEACREFLKKLSTTADLPTEAEWEYACRAGTRTTWGFGGDRAALKDHAWYRDNAAETTHPVAAKKPNPWGLYDMHGGVWEWCLDWYGRYSGDATDPRGPDSGDSRVCRGGAWFSNWQLTRSAIRSSLAEPWDTIGFRVVLRE